MRDVCEKTQGWLAVFVVAVLATVAGCAGTRERLPRCEGEASPINVPRHAAGHAGSGERGQ